MDGVGVAPKVIEIEREAGAVKVGFKSLYERFELYQGGGGGVGGGGGGIGRYGGEPAGGRLRRILSWIKKSVFFI